MKKAKNLNTNLFFGFLAFMSFVIFLLSFLFEGALNVSVLFVSFIFGALIPVFDFKENKKAYGRFDPLVYDLAALITFIFIDFYQSLLLLLIYAVGTTLNDLNSRHKTNAEKVSEEINLRRYHKNNMGERIGTELKDIKEKDVLELFSGEFIPVDGMVLSGSATVTTVKIDGVTNTFQVSPGDKLLSGTTILSGNLVMRADTDFKNSTICGISAYKKSIAKTVTQHEKKIIRLVHIITGAVFLAGLITSLVFAIVGKNPKLFAYGAVWTLFVCCTDSFKGLLHEIYLSSAMRCCNNGIVVKNKKLLEKSIFIKTLLFRKQGVLTTRKPTVSKVIPVDGVTENQLCAYAAYAHFRATHPVSMVLYGKYGKKVKNEDIAYFLETEHNGAMVQLKNGIEIITGTADVLAEYGINTGLINEEAVLCVAVNNVYVGQIVFEYEIKDDIRQYISSLKYAGAKNLTVITRDSERAAKDIALKTGIKNYICELDSEGIANIVNKSGKNTVYVGYGKGDSYEFNKECVKLMFGGFVYDSKTTDGLLLSDGFGCILKFFNIIKDTRALFVENFIISALVTGIIISIALHNYFAVPMGGVLILLGTILSGLNCYRMYKKL